MKIVYLFPHYAQKAGTERILIDKMNLLAEEGHEVTALSYEQGDHPFAFPLSEQVRHVDLNVRFFPLYRFNAVKRLLLTVVRRRQLVSRLREFVQSCRPDVVICTTYAPFEITTLSKVCAPLGIPIVVESHSVYQYSYSADMLSLMLHRHRLLSRRQLSKVNRVVALTEQDAAEWRKVVRRVEVVPNIVHLNDTGRYSNGQEKRVIFAGRFADQKGLPDLLRIWAVVHERHPEWRLGMYGSGPLKEWFLREIAQRDSGIFVHDPVADVMAQYIRSSILMLPSMYEPFGLVLVEAMSCGLPVVAFDCPYGPADIIADGEDGFLVKGRRVEVFASRLCQLMEDEELRLRMGQRAVASSQRYTAEKVMPKWRALLQDIAQEFSKKKTV